MTERFSGNVAKNRPEVFETWEGRKVNRSILSHLANNGRGIDLANSFDIVHRVSCSFSNPLC